VLALDHNVAGSRGATVSGRSPRCSTCSPVASSRATRPGNSPGSKWVAWNAIAEQLDYGRRHTARTNQLQRSFEDVSLKQRALEYVIAA
jgi:hypothetical protein